MENRVVNREWIAYKARHHTNENIYERNSNFHGWFRDFLIVYEINVTISVRKLNAE